MRQIAELLLLMVRRSYPGVAAASGSTTGGNSHRRPHEQTIVRTTQLDHLRLEVAPGHTVTMIEPSPGHLFIAEEMQRSQRLVLDDSTRDPISAFRRLRPGEPVPAVLLAAVERASKLRLTPPNPPGAPGWSGGQPASQAPSGGNASSGELTAVQQALTSSSNPWNFVNNDGGCAWSNVYSYCKVQWSNGFSGSAVVDHYSGDGVNLRFLINGAQHPIPAWQLNPGSVLQFVSPNGGNATRQFNVFNAINDSFHVGCRWY